MFFEAYGKLVNDFPDGCNQLFAQPLTAENSLWLSVDGDANPCLLFAARRDDPRTDIELRSVSVQFSRDCTIESAGGLTASGTYTVVRLKENDPDIVRMFLRLLEETFRDRERPYTNKEIASRILDVADLFKQINNSPGNIAGLWGELYILSRSEDFDVAVRCWCRHKMAKYDYVTKSFVMEAKTTVLTKRKHRFSRDQLRPNGDFRVYVASLTVVEVNSGQTTSEFIDELYDKISNDELRVRFFTQCLVKGGRDIYRNTLKLGVYPDQSSLVIFDADNIPVPEIATDSPIDNVRFDVVLSDIAPVSSREMGVVLAFGSK